MNKRSGFTIVELLVVIVVIGVLAAITIVSYSGISNKAIEASIQSDLSSATKQLKMFSVENNTYPSTIDCVQAESNTNKCLKSSSGNTYGYRGYGQDGFMLVSINGNRCYSITDNSHSVDNCVVIGSQTWMKYNLNVGTTVTNTTAPSNNSRVEKHCYNNLESNCSSSGGLYAQDEAMNYTGVPGTQGICPSNFHIPTDAEWKTLEIYLGMTQVQADATGDRGTDQGTQLKSGGSSGFNALMAGYINIVAQGFTGINNYGDYWTSNTNTTRELRPANATINRATNIAGSFSGFSVRCLKN